MHIISIKPSAAHWAVWEQMRQANKLLATFCAGNSCYTCIDTASALLGSDGRPRPEYYDSDGLHFSAAGYTAWNGVVRPVILAGERSSIVLPNLQPQDIGAVAAAGSVSSSGGVVTVAGSGADVWGSADEFHFAWQALSGDGQITARITSQSNTNFWAKAGVMVREQLTAGSRHAFMLLTPGAGATLQYRVTAGGATAGPSALGGAAPPYWLRLVRQGSTLAGYISTNGTSWSQVASVVIAAYNRAADRLARNHS